MRQLNYELKILCFHNRDGGFATQDNRIHQLQLCADQLLELGFRQMGVRSLS